MDLECKVVHETIIRDIVDIINDVKSSDEVKFLTNKNKSFRSIAQASSKLTLVFPCIISRSLSVDSAAMISKAVERKAVSMLQILFSAISVTDAEDAISYINKFHTNLKIDNDISIDSFIDTMDILANESCININDRELYESAKRDLLNLSHVLPDSINEDTLQDYIVCNHYGADKTKILQEKKRYNNDNRNTQQIKIKAKTSSSKIGSKYGDTKDVSNIVKNLADVDKNQLLDSDVKKANELVPTMMIINFLTKDAKTALPQHAIIGIKAKIYPVDSADMINRVILKHQDKQFLLKLIKATTREISFCRDFLFAIDRARLDALSQSKKGSSSKLWKVLERRALKSKIKRNLRNVNNALAISTLVISKEEVEYLKKNENINVEDVKEARNIMDSYNLMGICIVDESMEITSFIYDTGDDIYEQVPFRQLERESTNNEYKKIVNLMTKVTR